jgi:hypothetical protein
MTVTLNGFAYQLTEAASVATFAQLMEPGKDFAAVTGLGTELDRVCLLDLIALLISRNVPGSSANYELINRQIKLFAPGTELKPV